MSDLVNDHIAEMIGAAQGRQEVFIPLDYFNGSARNKAAQGRFLLVVERPSGLYGGANDDVGTGYVFIGEGRPTAQQVKDLIGDRRFSALVLWWITEEGERRLADLWNGGGDLHLSILRAERAQEAQRVQP